MRYQFLDHADDVDNGNLVLLDAYEDKDGGWHYHVGNKRKHDDEMLEGTDEGKGSKKHSALDGDACKE